MTLNNNSPTDNLIREKWDALSDAVSIAEVLVQGSDDPRANAIRLILTTLREKDAEIADLKNSVVAFGAPWAVRQAEFHGLPYGFIFANHYDILKAAGARMDSFTRYEESRDADQQ